MDQGKAHMVVGAAGMIGGALVKCLRASSQKVISADLWQEELNREKIHLNLASKSCDWILPGFVKTVYICSGITRLEECRKDPDGSSRVNVEGTLRLVEMMMMNKGTFVVFLSSSQVFDGTIPKVSAHHPQNPQSEYGRQKAAVEKYLSRWPKQTAIVRLTKVVGPDSIFSRWANSLRNKEIIHPFTDMFVSPIPLMTVVSILRLIGDQKLGGIWQISGDRDISYYDAAMIGAKIMKSNSNLIRPWSAVEANLDLEINPVNTTMDTKRLEQEFGLVPPHVVWTIKNGFKQN